MLLTSKHAHHDACGGLRRQDCLPSCRNGHGPRSAGILPASPLERRHLAGMAASVATLTWPVAKAATPQCEQDARGPERRHWSAGILPAWPRQRPGWFDATVMRARCSRSGKMLAVRSAGILPAWPRQRPVVDWLAGWAATPPCEQDARGPASCSRSLVRGRLARTSTSCCAERSGVAASRVTVNPATGFAALTWPDVGSTFGGPNLQAPRRVTVVLFVIPHKRACERDAGASALGRHRGSSGSGQAAAHVRVTRQRKGVRNNGLGPFRGLGHGADVAWPLNAALIHGQEQTWLR